MNEQHWNTITLDGSVPRELLLKMINPPCELVVKNFAGRSGSNSHEER